MYQQNFYKRKIFFLKFSCSFSFSFFYRKGITFAFINCRVCCIAEGEVDWSAWSLSRIASSSLVPFSKCSFEDKKGKRLCFSRFANYPSICVSDWVRSNPHYIVTNEGKIACKSDYEPSVLLSSSAQFGPGHSIEFTVSRAASIVIE